MARRSTQFHGGPVADPRCWDIGHGKTPRRRRRSRNPVLSRCPAVSAIAGSRMGLPLCGAILALEPVQFLVRPFDHE